MGAFRGLRGFFLEFIGVYRAIRGFIGVHRGFISF